MLDVLCLGEALWDLYAPRGASFERAPSLRLTPGGAAVNVVIHLATLGLSVGLAAVVGEDALGQALVARIAAAGVDTSRVTSAPPRTGLVFVERTEAGRRVVGYRAADEPTAKIPAVIGAKVLFLTGLMPSAAQLGSFTRAARRARRQGARVAIDLNARPRIWAGKDARLVAPLLHEADLLRCSTGDLAALGLDLPGARALLRRRSALVLSDGPGPTRALGPFGELLCVPRRARVLDPTGAGDALSAGLLAELVRGEGEWGALLTWERALARGHSLARAHLLQRGR